MDNKYLEQSIISTICYFDIFDYPLTLLEIWQWLLIYEVTIKESDLAVIIELLNTSHYLHDKLSHNKGFYFLKNRDEIVFIRLQRYALASHKNKIAKKGIAVIKFLPFISLVGLCNNSGNNNIRQDSDIDLFIVTAKNRLFMARFLVTLVISLRRLRRHDKKITDRLCLSFYASEDDLDFSKIKIKDNDIYLIYWIANLFPIYDRGGYDKFLAQNKWIEKYLPNHLAKYGSYWRREDDTSVSKIISKSLEYLLNGWLGDRLETFLKKIQFIKMSKNNKSLAKEDDSRVIINDTMLKFHENDRRLLYQEMFDNKLKEVIK